jgi:acetoin utilization deacetylase AcuC-like enzyme
LGDPLGQFRLDDDDYIELTEMLLELAGVTAGGRLISVLEGGYSLSGLSAAVQAHVEALER